MPGLFGAYDAEEIETDPNIPPVGTWQGTITDIDTYDYKEKTNITYEISDKDSAKKYVPQFTVMGLDAAKQKQAHGYHKAFLLRLEVPMAVVNEGELPEVIEKLKLRLLGQDVILTTESYQGKTDGRTYYRIKGYGEDISIRLDNVSSPTTSSSTPTATATSWSDL